MTQTCNALKYDTEELIRKGKLGQYVKKEEERQLSRSLRKGKAVVNKVGKALRKDNSDSEFEEDNMKSNGRLVAMVIFGGYPVEGGEKRKTMKKKWKEILSVASTSTIKVCSS